MKKTKMVCTIGPKSEKREVMETLLNSGMNVMRLNFSHGDFEEHGGRITNINAIMKETGKVFAVLLDTKGPEIRTCDLENGEDVELTTGDKITLTSDASFVGNKTKVGVTYPDLAKDLKVGSTVLLDDGLIGLTVTAINGDDVECEVQNNGVLGEHKGVNLPNTHISMPFLSEKDKGDLLFGIKRDVDFIAASFTRTKEDVLDIRNFLDANGGNEIKIICKIENQEGLDNFEDILATADGIMVARGDMGVEIPAQEVIFAQKHIIKRCNEVGKPVITATQMLDSMIKNPRPTRAEAGDVTNAILDGTDAVMLSGESAKGKYPREAVRTMNTICERTDSYCEEYADEVYRYVEASPTVTDSACLAAVEASESLNAPVIVVATEHGNSARAIRKFNPNAVILALTPNYKAARQLCLTRGVLPKIVDRINSTDEFFKLGKKLALELGLAKAGDKIIMVNGALVPSGITNTMSVQTI
ncbi:MAG: pyruvate kinase PykF [Succinivibrio sp.]|uniref:pyruvate kinase PykF n=1 Tax=Succinivibrio dextrinosolvens TaxID=83771 RepID=UPI0004E21BC6|nr:pyruvate kinase PykF [Succinivibrio dextrinosolvens]MBE6422149.1 pyruvate kinase PykF [Succinivibrio dextrinosolvens]MBQ3678608.1 pyruvate kinase PykF [Succinivibrio sp.]